MLIHYTSHFVTGPKKFLTAGDAIQKYLELIGLIYGPFLACSVESKDCENPLTEELVRTCGHAKEMAVKMLHTCQFMPCHCQDKFCQVNQLYCRLVSATYGFSRHYARITGIDYSVNMVSKIGYG